MLSRVLIACALLLAMLLHGKSDATDIVKYIDSIESVDPQKDYYIDILKLAMEKSEEEYGPYELHPIAVPMWQDRQLQSVQLGMLDIIWTMTSQDREDNFLPIRIPLMRGLIGFRVSMILRQSQPLFSQMNNTVDLKRRLALQGHDWPDTDILRTNGFRVTTTSTYENFFALLQKPNVHYIPRGLLEGYFELEKLNKNVFMIEEKHALVYPTAIYFFTSLENSRLAARIEYGLRVAQEDGSFDTHFTEFPRHKAILSKAPLRGRTVHCLSNPLLPDIFPLNDPTLWMGTIDADYAVCDFRALSPDKSAPQEGSDDKGEVLDTE